MLYVLLLKKISLPHIHTLHILAILKSIVDIFKHHCEGKSTTWRQPNVTLKFDKKLTTHGFYKIQGRNIYWFYEKESH